MEEGLALLRKQLVVYEEWERAHAQAEESTSPKGGKELASDKMLAEEHDRDQHAQKQPIHHTEGSLKAQQRVFASLRSKKEAQERENALLDELLRAKTEREREMQRAMDQSIRAVRREAKLSRVKGKGKRTPTPTSNQRTRDNHGEERPRTRGEDTGFSEVSWSLAPVPALHVHKAQAYQKGIPGRTDETGEAY